MYISNDKCLIYPLNCKTCSKQNVGVLTNILDVDGTTITIRLMLEKMRVVHEKCQANFYTKSLFTK